MSVEADPVWRIVAAASVAAIYRTLPRGAQPSGQRQSDLVSFADAGKKEHGSSAVSRTTGRPAEVLREGVDGTGVRDIEVGVKPPCAPPNSPQSDRSDENSGVPGWR